MRAHNACLSLIALLLLCRTIQAQDGTQIDDLAGGGGAETSPPPPHRSLTEAVNPLPIPQPKVHAGTVLAMTLAMAAAAGLGALPYFFVRTLSASWAALATASACGVMLAASFDLIHEGQPHGGEGVFMGIIAGAVFIQWTQRRMDSYKDVKFQDLRGSAARRSVMMVGIMAAHAIGEGCGVGVSFSGPRGWTQGLLTTLAIGVHNIPEGLATATVLVSQGLRPRSALMWSIVACLPQPLVALPSYMFVEAFEALLPAALGFAAGCMVWMVVAELLPEALADAPPARVAMAATLSAAGLEGFRMLVEGMERPLDGLLRLPIPSDLLLPSLWLAAAGCGAAALAGAGVAAARPPRAVALGAAGALLGGRGAATLARQLLLGSPGGIPVLHTLAGAGTGAAAALLLRACLLPRCAAACGRGSGLDEAEGGLEGGGGGRANGHPAAPAFSTPASPSKSGARLGGGAALAPHAMAACLLGIAAAALTALPTGWDWAAALLLQREAGFLLLPVTLAALAPGMAAGTAAAAMLAGGEAPAAALAGAAGAGAAATGAAAALAALARYPVATAADARVVLVLWRYPLGLGDTVASAAAGAALAAALGMLGTGMLVSAGRARGGAVLGLAGLCLLWGLQAALCSASPYCLLPALTA